MRIVSSNGESIEFNGSKMYEIIYEHVSQFVDEMLNSKFAQYVDDICNEITESNHEMYAALHDIFHELLNFLNDGYNEAEEECTLSVCYLVNVYDWEAVPVRIKPLELASAAIASKQKLLYLLRTQDRSCDDSDDSNFPKNNLSLLNCC